MKRAATGVALALLLLAAGLRLHGLAEWSFDGDEIYTYYDVRTVLAGGPWPEGVRSHPLGYLAIAGCALLLGDGEGALRLSAALCGIAAVGALLALRRDVLSRAQALAAGALAALSPFLLFHAQEARFYGPLFLCATLATLWALPGRGRRSIAALLAGLAALACHPSAVLLLPCLALPPFARRASAGTLLLVTGAGLAGAAAWVAFGESAAPTAVRTALLRQQLAHYDAAHFVAGFAYNVGAGVGALAAWGSVKAWRQGSEGERQLLLAAWLAPLLLLGAALLGVSVQQRYAMASLPALLLLAGQALAGWARRPAAAGLVLGLALLPSLPQLLDTIRTGDRSDMRGAAAWLAAHARPGDSILADEHSTLELYLRRFPDFADTESHEAPPPRARQLWSLLRHERDCWVVVKRNRLSGAYGEEFTQWLADSFVERAQIGTPPIPLARHDNVLLIFQRRSRTTPEPPSAPEPQPHGSPTPVPDRPR